MPTYDTTPRFDQDWQQLTPAQRKRFLAAVRTLVEDLRAKQPPRPSLGIERLEGRKGVFEFHWAPDGRATFTYGTSPHPGDVHIIWLRVGTHDIYKG